MTDKSEGAEAHLDYEWAEEVKRRHHIDHAPSPFVGGRTIAFTRCEASICEEAREILRDRSEPS